MPELPEVETVRRSLEDNIIGHSIRDIKVNRNSIIEGDDESSLKIKLLGRVFHKVDRKAKHLLLYLDDGTVILAHLKMSGSFLYKRITDMLDKHCHVQFILDKEQQLVFRDMRTFGKISVWQDEEALFSATNILKLAPEPLSEDFSLSYFSTKIKTMKSSLKALLLDQYKVVAGLGNIYVDEVLFASRLHPERLAHTLKDAEIKSLYENINSIIKGAIERGGTSFRDYIDSNGKKGQYAPELYVYGRKNQPCKVCTEIITYLKIQQRGTHICSNCQK